MYTVPTDLSERDRSGNDCFGVVFVEFWMPRTEDATRVEYCVQDCSNTITQSTRVQYPHSRAVVSHLTPSPNINTRDTKHSRS